MAIEEKLVVQMTRDGAVENLEVKGTLSLTVANSDVARCALRLRRGDNAAGYQFQNHPNINKALFQSDAVLALKNTDREFPTGAAATPRAAPQCVCPRALWVCCVTRVGVCGGGQAHRSACCAGALRAGTSPRSR